jgi:hypothetical protein
MSGLYVPEDVQPAAIRHMDVEKDQVPVLLAQRIERFVAAGGFAYDVDAGICLEELLKSGPDYRMIVCD